LTAIGLTEEKRVLFIAPLALSTTDLIDNEGLMTRYGIKFTNVSRQLAPCLLSIAFVVIKLQTVEIVLVRAQQEARCPYYLHKKKGYSTQFILTTNNADTVE
jgi:hypothetical protein